jgi:hypothetical protein
LGPNLNLSESLCLGHRANFPDSSSSTATIGFELKLWLANNLPHDWRSAEKMCQ